MLLVSGYTNDPPLASYPPSNCLIMRFYQKSNLIELRDIIFSRQFPFLVLFSVQLLQTLLLIIL